MTSINESKTIWNISNINAVYNDNFCIIKSIFLILNNNKLYIKYYLFEKKYYFTLEINNSNIKNNNSKIKYDGYMDILPSILEEHGLCPLTSFYIKVKFNKSCFVKFKNDKKFKKLYKVLIDVSNYFQDEIIFPIEKVVTDFFHSFWGSSLNHFKNALDCY